MSRRRLLFLALASAGVLTPLVGQSQSSRTPAARRAAPDARSTFAETIAPIVYANCVTCHRPGEAAPFGFLAELDGAAAPAGHGDQAERGKLFGHRDVPSALRFVVPS